jgi:hypothetical protein
MVWHFHSKTKPQDKSDKALTATLTTTTPSLPIRKCPFICSLFRKLFEVLVINHAEAEKPATSRLGHQQ